MLRTINNCLTRTRAHRVTDTIFNIRDKLAQLLMSFITNFAFQSFWQSLQRFCLGGRRGETDNLESKNMQFPISSNLRYKCFKPGLCPLSSLTLFTHQEKFVDTLPDPSIPSPGLTILFSYFPRKRKLGSPISITTTVVVTIIWSVLGTQYQPAIIYYVSYYLRGCS